MARKIRITISTVWSVGEKDNDMANKVLEEQPKDIACDYIEDAWHGDSELEIPTVKWEEEEGKPMVNKVKVELIVSVPNPEGCSPEETVGAYFGRAFREQLLVAGIIFHSVKIRRCENG